MISKILIVGNSFFPENSPRAFRTTELAVEFAKQGYKVTVMVPKNLNYDTQFEKKYNVDIKDLGQNKFKEIDLNNGGKLVVFFKRILRRSLDLLLDYPSIGWMFKVKRALKNTSGYDLLISIAAPHPIHWGVALVWNKNKIAKTWVADCGDPFMGVTTDTFKKPFYFKYVEKYWCKRVDHIAVPFEGAKSAYYEEFNNKIKVIPQGVNFDGIKIAEYKPHKIPTFAYAGGFIPGARDPIKFLEYLLSLEREFKFIIYTRSNIIKAPLIERAKGKVVIRDYIPRKELLIALSEMDFVVNFNNGVPTQLPSKLIDYYLTTRPVLSIDSYNFNPKVIIQFLEGDYTNQFKFSNPDQYRIENVCHQFLTL